MSTPKRATKSRATRSRKPPAITLTQEQVEQLASDAAERALNQFFLSIGIDTSTPDGIIAAQRDFQHLRAWRTSVETVRRQGIISAIGVLTVGLLALIWARIANPAGPP